ncbi:MAG: PhoH family protein [Erysipelotrichaceae bacterium]|nr:PhoH family protein [Erysipelotrichaceae bacterium]
MAYKEIIINDLRHDELKEFVGVNNENIKLLEELFRTEMIFRGDTLKVDAEGEKFNMIVDVVDTLLDNVKESHYLDETYIKQTFKNYELNKDVSWQNKTAIITNSGKPIRYKTYTQYKFANSLYDNDLIFSSGPAGTGKTYFAVVMACKALKQGDTKKIILTRPAVEAGESLGFLPGDLKEKIDPYLMPLYDALEDILGTEQVEKLMEKGVIEVIPLAYMRGRTLNDAFIILDEAQNTTEGQMLMFLTRLGYNSKMIVNGDITQIDLNIKKEKSGLVAALNKLQGIKKIGFIEFNKTDIVRNPLVEKIIENFHL